MTIYTYTYPSQRFYFIIALPLICSQIEIKQYRWLRLSGPRLEPSRSSFNLSIYPNDEQFIQGLVAVIAIYDHGNLEVICLLSSVFCFLFQVSCFKSQVSSLNFGIRVNEWLALPV